MAVSMAGMRVIQIFYIDTTIIFRLFLRIAQDFIRQVDFPKHRFCLCFFLICTSRMSIRVPFQSRFSIPLLDLCLGRVSTNIQNFVKVLLLGPLQRHLCFPELLLHLPLLIFVSPPFRQLHDTLKVPNSFLTFLLSPNHQVTIRTAGDRLDIFPIQLESFATVINDILVVSQISISTGPIEIQFCPIKRNTTFHIQSFRIGARSLLEVPRFVIAIALSLLFPKTSEDFVKGECKFIVRVSGQDLFEVLDSII